jgi:excisionase family DNA binding protein
VKPGHPTTENKAYFTSEQVAERYQVKEQTVRLWIKRGLLKARKLGHSWRISRIALAEFEGENAGED